MKTLIEEPIDMEHREEHNVIEQHHSKESLEER
jgi:hypothetical protein